ncbi:MAG: Rieske (2Fe-2S) protein [Proteobacteria bacterium]|nr:Rieske (2Fe-2S) protein [Pseudomonadota bacterium]
MSKSSDVQAVEWVRAAELERLGADGIVVVTVGDARVAVIAHGERVFAVDNRCPHMGFPLDRGSVSDGILTCHWHQARFDLASGCTFDLFADDVPAYETRIEAGVVYVSAQPRQARDARFHGERLRRGIEQNVPLVQAKSLLGLLEVDAFDRVIAEVGTYATQNLASFSEGLVRLTCVANLRPYLTVETTYQALFYAVRQVAAETSTAVPRKRRSPLEPADHDLETLCRWLRQWVQTRHLDAAERTLLTGARVLDEESLAALLLGAAAERLFANTGHLFDFSIKALELAEHLGDGGTEAVLSLLTTPLTSVRGEEESTAWHHPIEIVEPLRELEAELPELLAQAARGVSSADWSDRQALVEVLLGDDPMAILAALRDALAQGAPPARLAARVAYAAALRLARFATSNEVTDWFNVQHTMNFTCAVHRAVQRTASPDVVRAIFHGAIAVYMDRYLNVPPARLPGERGSTHPLPTGRDELLGALLETLDQRAEIATAAALVSRYLRQKHPFDALVDTLTFATVREDLDFHSLQVLAGGVRLCDVWKGGLEVEHIMVGVVRNLAAHCPTRRGGQQTASIALRLHRGDPVYEEAES